MQVEQIDKLTAAKRWMSAIPRHDFDHILTLIHDATERHRHQARAEVVGEIVAWLRGQGEHGSERAQAWGETFADQIEAKFGKKED